MAAPLPRPFPAICSSRHHSSFHTDRRHAFAPFIFFSRSPFVSPSIARRTLSAPFAITESGSSNNLDASAQHIPILHDLSEILQLPPDYLSSLPRDLRLDVNDAAFDLSNGPVLDECGQEAGEVLLNLSRAWEKADTVTSNRIASQLLTLDGYLSGDAKSAFGKRLVAAGSRFKSMGAYGNGELQKIAKTMVDSGRLLSQSPIEVKDQKPKKETRMFKFGDLQVAVTWEKAIVGSAIASACGLLSWQVSQGVQSIPENSFQYSNDNAVLLAKSLRGALLVLFYSSATLSAFASIGLLLLATRLGFDSDTDER